MATGMEKQIDIFVSVGDTANDQQEKSVAAIEDRLRAEGLTPHSVGRNAFSSDAPLISVRELMDQCKGMVVIALERLYFERGLEKRGGPKQVALKDVRIATPWNQIEAAMAYSRGLPLLVIVEEGIRDDGLLERGNEWYVMYIKDQTSLNTKEFNGVFSSWKQKVISQKKKAMVNQFDVNQSIASLVGKSESKSVLGCADSAGCAPGGLLRTWEMDSGHAPAREAGRSLVGSTGAEMIERSLAATRDRPRPGVAPWRRRPA